jgi:hypothetical protein
VTTAFFPFRFDARYAPLWGPLALWPGRNGVTVDEDTFQARLGLFNMQTSRDNVMGGHITESYQWFKAIGIRLSRVDDGLTFGTNRDRGVCVHFRDRVPPVIGPKSHSALTVTVADCEGLLELIGHAPARTNGER